MIQLKHGTKQDDILTINGRDTVIYGGSGNDTFIDTFPCSDDFIFCGQGNDTVFTADGFDKIWGKGGNDRFIVEDRDASVLIIGGEGHDVIKMLDRSQIDFEITRNGNNWTLIDESTGFNLEARGIEHIHWGY